MASLELDPASGHYRVRFRYAGREFKRSARTKHHRVASGVLGQVEATLRLLQLGMAQVPEKVDVGDFVVSGARTRRERHAPSSPVRTLADLFRVYQQELPSGAKESRTLEGEKLHFKHLLRRLKPSSRVSAFSSADVQRYVEKRSADSYRGKATGPDTIRKEISTLRLVWSWARAQGYLENAPPVDRVVYPKRDEKPPFMTMEEVGHILVKSVLLRVEFATIGAAPLNQRSTNPTYWFAPALVPPCLGIVLDPWEQTIEVGRLVEVLEDHSLAALVLQQRSDGRQREHQRLPRPFSRDLDAVVPLLARDAGDLQPTGVGPIGAHRDGTMDRNVYVTCYALASHGPKL